MVPCCYPNPTLNTHPIFPQMLLPNNMHIVPHKLTKMSLHPLLHGINPKGIKKPLQGPHLPNPIHLLIILQPHLLIDLRIHHNNPIEPHHRLPLHAPVHVGVLTVHFDFPAFASFVLARVVVEVYGFFGGVVVVSVGESAEANGYFFSHEDHGEVLVVGYVEYKMSSGEN